MEENRDLSALEDLIGITFGPEHYDIEKGMVERYLGATGDNDPRWRQETPPTFPTALVPRELVHRIFNADIPQKRTLNGGNELEYFHTIHVGDRITVMAVTESVKKVIGMMGAEVFVYTDITYTNQHGDVVARGKNTYIKL